MDLSNQPCTHATAAAGGCRRQLCSSPALLPCCPCLLLLCCPVVPVVPCAHSQLAQVSSTALQHTTQGSDQCCRKLTAAQVVLLHSAYCLYCVSYLRHSYPQAQSRVHKDTAHQHKPAWLKHAHQQPSKCLQGQTDIYQHLEPTWIWLLSTLRSAAERSWKSPASPEIGLRRPMRVLTAPLACAAAMARRMNCCTPAPGNMTQKQAGARATSGQQVRLCPVLHDSALQVCLLCCMTEPINAVWRYQPVMPMLCWHHALPYRMQTHAPGKRARKPSIMACAAPGLVPSSASCCANP